MRRLLASLPDDMLAGVSHSSSGGDAAPATAAPPTVQFAFPRSSRLLNAGDYSQVFKQNRRFADRFWTALVHRDESRPARLGLAIAKKRARRAVDRNRLKRVTRESFRHQQQTLTGLQIVVMNRDPATKASSGELRASLDTLLGKIIRASGSANRNPPGLDGDR